MIYITVYKPIAGWKAVLMDSEEGPMQTGHFAYETKEEAIKDAKYWAEADNIQFKLDGDIEIKPKEEYQEYTVEVSFAMSVKARSKTEARVNVINKLKFPGDIIDNMIVTAKDLPDDE